MNTIACSVNGKNDNHKGKVTTRRVNIITTRISVSIRRARMTTTR